MFVIKKLKKQRRWKKFNYFCKSVIVVEEYNKNKVVSVVNNNKNENKI